MKIHLQNSVWIGNIDPFINSFDQENEKVLEITSHKRWVSVHPVVLCLIAGLGLLMREHKTKINFEKMTARSKHYFERMKLFEFLNVRSNIQVTTHESAGRFIPLIQIKTSEDLDNFIREMIPLLRLKQGQAEPIKYIVSELIRNVLEHASSTYGAVVCAQYYKKSNTIRIGVVDVGVGIKKTLEKYYHPKNDFDAIILALTPGITGTTKKIGGTERNAGAGLFFIKSLAKISRDFFMIYSGNAMYKLLKTKQNNETKLISDPSQDHFSCKEDLPFWKGTVVAIDLCLNETINFSELLTSIGEVYRERRKEETKMKYKKPRFI